MRWRAGAVTALGAASILAVACGIAARGTLEVTAVEDDASAADAIGATPSDGAIAFDGGSDGGDAEAGPPCLTDGGGAGMECDGACINPLDDRANCGAC